MITVLLRAFTDSMLRTENFPQLRYGNFKYHISERQIFYLLQKYRMLDRFLHPKVFHAKTSALCTSRKKIFIEKAHRNQKCEQCALVRLFMNPTVTSSFRTYAWSFRGVRNSVLSGLMSVTSQISDFEPPLTIIWLRPKLVHSRVHACVHLSP